MDEDGRCWAIRHFEHEKMLVLDAARVMHENTMPGEVVQATYAPNDIWNRQKDTGRTMAEIFRQEGINLVKSDNNRVQGHMIMKIMMAPVPLNDPFVKSLFPPGGAPETLPGLMFFNNLDKPMSDIQSIQSDDKNPNDCAKEPHDITHNVDAVRYFCITRKMAAEAREEKKEPDEDEDEGTESYEEYMCGSGGGQYLM